MVKWLMQRGIAAFERQWNYDASYVHEIIEASPRAAWMFSRAAAIGKYRKDVPACGIGSRGDYGGSTRGLRPVHSAGCVDVRASGRRCEGPARRADRGSGCDARRRGAGLAVHARDDRPRSVRGPVSRRNHQTVGTEGQ